MNNIFNDISRLQEHEETFQELLTHKNVTIERIVSKSFKNGSWMVQQHDEWVLLIQGDALMEFNDRNVSLKQGEYLFIKAHEAHRVLETSQSAIWLAVHIH